MHIDLTGLPPLDFGDPPQGIAPRERHWHGSLGMRICALMAWPNDGDARRRFLASVAADQMDRVSKAPMPEGWPQDRARVWGCARQNVASEISKIDFETHGGLGSVVRADSLERLFAQIRKHSEHWQSAGAQLWLCRSIDLHHRADANGGASLNKSWSMLSAASPWNIDRLQSDWKTYRPVAHLCAAIVLLLSLAARKADSGEIPPDHALMQQGAWFFDGLPFLLATARDYQKWATSYLPYGRSEPLIALNRLWVIPDDLPPWEYTVEPPRLDGAFLTALHAYGAPKRRK